MAKRIEEKLLAARARKEKLLVEKERISVNIREVDAEIRELEKRQKKEKEAAVIKRMEATGFTVEDILKLLEEKQEE